MPVFQTVEREGESMKPTSPLRKVAACKGVWKYLAVAVLSACASVLVYANSQTQKLSPGLQPFTPTRIDWLTTTLQASLRDEVLDTNGYTLQIANPDPETILIYVRYRASVNREAMNIFIDTAREVIQITAKSYGWENWVKVRENIQLAGSEAKQ
jgi:hypothetical protein